jgi:hypothetical protein
VVDWSRKIARSGGVVTRDLPIGRDGLIPRPFLDQLAAVGRGLGPK